MRRALLLGAAVCLAVSTSMPTANSECANIRRVSHSFDGRPRERHSPRRKDFGTPVQG